jgi:hypothetical protein
VLVDGPEQFWAYVDRLEADARAGDRRARQVLKYLVDELAVLQEREGPPSNAEESLDLKWVRQSRRYPLWRVSHPFDVEVAIRLICWFPPNSATVVVALFSGDKKKIGDVWYDSVASRADPLIDQWKREKEQEP